MKPFRVAGGQAPAQRKGMRRDIEGFKFLGLFRLWYWKIRIFKWLFTESFKEKNENQQAKGQVSN